MNALRGDARALHVFLVLLATCSHGQAIDDRINIRPRSKETDPANAAAMTGGAKEIERFVAMLQSKDADEREAGADYLAKRGPEAIAVLPNVMPLLADEADGVCIAAIRAICAMGPPSHVVPDLVRAARRRLGQEGACLAALYNCDFRPEAIPPLTAELGMDPNSDEIPENILAGLGAMVLPRVQEVLAEGGYRAQSAVSVLWRLGPVAKPALPSLVSALRGGKISDFSFAYALETLDTVSPEATTELERIARESEDSRARSTADAVLRRRE